MPMHENAEVGEQSQVRWDPQEYDRFERERAQPFVDLLSRVELASPVRIVDLGCGTGSTTALLARRWPDAEVVGLDSSPEMLQQAAATAELPANLRFEQRDIAAWMPGPDDSLVVTNAALQWLPDHVSLLPRWLDALPAGSWFAMQVPHSAPLPSHQLLNRLVRSDRWREQLGEGIRAGGTVAPASDYLELMLSCGLDAQVWETEYLHMLTGADPVLAWVRGTSLRPVLARLSDDDAELFEQQYSALLREAYPRTAHGTVYPFRRILAVGRRR